MSNWTANSLLLPNYLPPYRYIVESTTGMCSPNIFGVRIPNNGAILTAAIGHQVFHVALPRHIQEIDAIYIYFLKIPTALEVRQQEIARPGFRKGVKWIWNLQSNPHFDVDQRQGWGSKESHGSEAAAGCSPDQITPHNALPGAFMAADGEIKSSSSQESTIWGNAGLQRLVQNCASRSDTHCFIH